ncbi:class I SAM-dependent methyltransferase [Jidongwangia harbinensis]|uniref:class I SAM-dependent methyltransferase n=1 Tax=Jidongwangia harbinensis TaxID=2878561 RepID=UPI001CD94B0B|nr:class I SAM-dependent methyltransferase [Jidongwangia harbinensis]MCA2212227.1 class I SAM-dependent methyltransferase [Jidongwangia harbinensis]
MLQPEIMAFYQRGGERDRLATGPGRLEFLRTRDVLGRVLPAAPATVLDVGGATGAYAEPLARDGYRVHVVDPVSGHVSLAAARPGVTAAVGDARTLPAADRSADVVLLLGPLYHLPDRADRVTAWREAARVLRPGGLVVAATISRYASLFAGFVTDVIADPRFEALVDGALVDGAHRNADPAGPWLVTAYFHHPDEIAAEAADAGLAVQRRFAVEGPLWMSGPRLDDILDRPDRTAQLLAKMRLVEEDPTLFGASSHLLSVARAG